ncbi:hypothetical protein IscW_ISCW020905 [Ixodes scapularis]|uniref:Uncharacterized protein n=1 Tax=Ixodes scapularis TaxID=6945 RepID=B7Q409_IXOSC|nr:hypothetical protein IscW_ISCW020905 [Ixodes scapularis]|eukprot:XP_002399803.1 hypothetical protein IscW_ISCW020905 [Ixodes scapularis]
MFADRRSPARPAYNARATELSSACDWYAVAVTPVVPQHYEKVQPGSTPCVANEHERNDRLALRCYGNSSFHRLHSFVSVVVAPNATVRTGLNFGQMHKSSR